GTNQVALDRVPGEVVDLHLRGAALVGRLLLCGLRLRGGAEREDGERQTERTEDLLHGGLPQEAGSQRNAAEIRWHGGSDNVAWFRFQDCADKKGAHVDTRRVPRLRPSAPAISLSYSS